MQKEWLPYLVHRAYQASFKIVSYNTAPIALKAIKKLFEFCCQRECVYYLNPYLFTPSWAAQGLKANFLCNMCGSHSRGKAGMTSLAHETLMLDKTSEDQC